MKRILTLLVIILFPLLTFAQSMYSDAIECMNNGEYKDAKVYFEALNGNNAYSNKITICNECIKLQAQANIFENISSSRLKKNTKRYFKEVLMIEMPSVRLECVKNLLQSINVRFI